MGFVSKVLINLVYPPLIDLSSGSLGGFSRNRQKRRKEMGGWGQELGQLVLPADAWRAADFDRERLESALRRALLLVLLVPFRRDAILKGRRLPCR
jgi:hypothetical protein